MSRKRYIVGVVGGRAPHRHQSRELRKGPRSGDASFAGEEGKQQAYGLADELSKDYGLPAFIHEEKFDFGGKLNINSPDGRMARYANQSQYQAYAVLVGEYDSSDHPQLKKDLVRLKAMQPKSIHRSGVDAQDIDPNHDDNPLVAVRKLLEETTDGTTEEATAD